MAEIIPTKTTLRNGTYKYTWEIVNGDTAQPISLPDYVLKTYHISGTFGASGAIGIQESNDDSVYINSKDISNSDITGVVANSTYVPIGSAGFSKPVISAAHASIDVTISVVVI